MSDARNQWREALQPSPDCIPVARLGDVLSAAEQRHVATCARCESELTLLRAVMDDAERDGEHEHVQRVQRALEQRLSDGARVLPLRREPQFAAAAAALFVAVIGGSLWWQSREPALDVVPTTSDVYRSDTVEVVAPIGDLTTAPNGLQWKSVSGADHYRVQLMSVDRATLWSGESVDTRIALPAGQVAPGRTLLWSVEALRGSDVIARSAVQSFRLLVQ